MVTQNRELTIPFSDSAYVYLEPANGFSRVGIWVEDRKDWLNVDARALITLPDHGGDMNAALDQMNRARTLGYSHVEPMVCEHDLLHMWLAKERGLPYSPTLYHVATGTDGDPDERAYEEADVLGLTYYLNTNRWNDHWGEGKIPPNDRRPYRDRALDFLVGLGLRVWEP